MPSFDLFSFRSIDLHSLFPVILPNHAVQGFRTTRFLHLWGGETLTVNKEDNRLSSFKKAAFTCFMVLSRRL